VLHATVLDHESWMRIRDWMLGGMEGVEDDDGGSVASKSGAATDLGGLEGFHQVHCQAHGMVARRRASLGVRAPESLSSSRSWTQRPLDIHRGLLSWDD
jgi:hypothetical protein